MKWEGPIYAANNSAQVHLTPLSTPSGVYSLYCEEENRGHLFGSKFSHLSRLANRRQLFTLLG